MTPKTLIPGSARPDPVPPDLLPKDEGDAGSEGQAQLPWPRADRVLSYAILACGLLTLMIGAYQILSARSRVPIWDEWSEIDAVVTAPHYQPPISWLWSQHNEHRIVFYRLLLLADIHIFHGAHAISFWSMLVMQCMALVLLLRMSWNAGLRGARWRVFAGLAAFCLFCPSQWENFGWAFQISFLLPGAFLLAALTGLVGYQRSTASGGPSGLWLAMSILAASAATYSNANGVVVWPVLIIVAAVLRVRFQVLALYAVSAAALIGSYLYHYVSPVYHSSPLQSLLHPLAIFGYAARFLGVVLPPWVRMRDSVAVGTGTLGILAGLGAAWIVLKRDRWRKPLPATLLGLMLFALATAFLTALGRVGFGSSQAYQSRYQTFNLLFWFSTVTLWLLFTDAGLPWLRRVALTVVPIVMLLAAGLLFPLCLRASRLRTSASEAAALALVEGVPDKQALAVLYPDPSLPWRDAVYLKQDKLFMFSEPAAAEMGKPIFSAYPGGTNSDCTGQIDAVERIPPVDLLTTIDSAGLRISGTAVNGKSGDPIRRLVIAADGRIAGFAVGGLQIMRNDKTFLRKSRFTEWQGLVLLPPHAPSIDVYALSGRDGICRLGTTAVPVF